jgi:hypothetical protein
MAYIDHLRLSLDCWSCIPYTRKGHGGAPRCRYRGAKTGTNCVRNNGSSQLLPGTQFNCDGRAGGLVSYTTVNADI